MMRVVACQQRVDLPLSSATVRRIKSFSADFVCLPEHYPLWSNLENLQQAADIFDQRKNYLCDLSRSLDTVVVGGTLTEKTENGFYNTCYIFDRGIETGFYRKVNPTEGEMARGVLKGREFKVFDVRDFLIGVLICADVLIAQSFEQLASLQCDVVFVPTASPLRAGESVQEKYERDRSIFLEGARKLACPVVKACGVGSVFGHPLQGRSLIATPQEIIARALPHQEDKSLLLSADLA